VLDLGMSWKPARPWSVAANLNNVFDRTYWRWSDVRGIADNSTTKDAYTAPGRNLQVSIRYDF
jgi:hemoglobin/transferrin/lactoferrin receptor protein